MLTLGMNEVGVFLIALFLSSMALCFLLSISKRNWSSLVNTALALSSSLLPSSLPRDLLMHKASVNPTRATQVRGPSIEFKVNWKEFKSRLWLCSRHTSRCYNLSLLHHVFHQLFHLVLVQVWQHLIHLLNLDYLFSSEFFSQITSRSHSIVILMGEAPLSSLTYHQRGGSRVWQSCRGPRSSNLALVPNCETNILLSSILKSIHICYTWERKRRDRVSNVSRRRILLIKAKIWPLGELAVMCVSPFQAREYIHIISFLL